ncbi:SAM-dependent methyltransferase [Magnetovibrio sp. PR-2]|uniref:class I SAM-dependent methyltransferase n=1 Tax=Magnetovibrio sp. PR-2 TaxID=3120356 RepID=UPI002FCDFA18
MSALFDIIKAEIEAEGPITVARYMELALAHPEHGYYQKQDPLGEEGDFITAPEISQMFGEMIGLWMAVVWQGLNQPDPLNVVEFGPGRGTLMADALRAAQAMDDFDDAARVWLIETSPALRAKQKEMLKPTMLMPAWRDTFADVGSGPLIVLGNEFFDALPVHQIERADDGWRERLVGLNDEGDKFAFTLSQDLADSSVIPEELRNSTVPGSIFEYQPLSKAIMKEVAERIVAEGGAALFIDYGHGEHGTGETLQALRAHKYSDPLKNPGDADLTCHVDFAQLTEAAAEAGADVLGPVPQGAFLERLGMGERANMLMMSATEEQVAEIDAAYKRLTGPDEMGQLFKVMAIVPKGFGVPPWAE